MLKIQKYQGYILSMGDLNGSNPSFKTQEINILLVLCFNYYHQSINLNFISLYFEQLSMKVNTL
jgi:hypothetical protein